MGSGDCIRRHVGGADVDDGALFNRLKKSLWRMPLRRWGTVNLVEVARRAGTARRNASPSSIADEGEASHDQDVCESDLDGTLLNALHEQDGTILLRHSRADRGWLMWFPRRIDAADRRAGFWAGA